MLAKPVTLAEEEHKIVGRRISRANDPRVTILGGMWIKGTICALPDDSFQPPDGCLLLVGAAGLYILHEGFDDVGVQHLWVVISPVVLCHSLILRVNHYYV